MLSRVCIANFCPDNVVHGSLCSEFHVDAATGALRPVFTLVRYAGSNKNAIRTAFHRFRGGLRIFFQRLKRRPFISSRRLRYAMLIRRLILATQGG